MSTFVTQTCGPGLRIAPLCGLYDSGFHSFVHLRLATQTIFGDSKRLAHHDNEPNPDGSFDSGVPPSLNMAIKHVLRSRRQCAFSLIWESWSLNRRCCGNNRGT
jgi:hypothetical protein